MSAEAKVPNASPLGAPMDRVDGRLKVTGGARYAAEMPVERVAHAVLVTSTVARGRVASADTAAAEGAPGVLAVLTPFNAPRLPTSDKALLQPPAGRKLTLLQDDRVYYNGQPVGVVVADTLERARAAADLVRLTYDAERPELDLRAVPAVPASTTQARPGGNDPPTSKRGDVDAGLLAADVRVDATYTTPIETHNPMEMHATIAAWEQGPAGERLTLYDATQGVFGVRNVAAKTFALLPEQVRVVSYFLGGGFGSKGSAWSHVLLAAMAARRVGRPVKLMLTRRQMFGPVGARPRTEQRVTLGATRDGALTAVRHTSTANTSTLEDWLEPSAIATRILYACPNLATDHALARLNVGTPTFMRAPGEASGTFAIESAMDELAYALRMDPVALRLKNYAERDPESGKPWSSKSLRQCYAVGMERFGWARRAPEPRATADGRWLVGYGMATATYPTRRSKAEAVARVLPDGRAWVRAGTQDIGTGTYTVMTQVAADALGISADRVRFELGDTLMPENPGSGGSRTAASTGSAVHEAALAARARVAAMAAADPASPLHGARPEEVGAADGRLFLTADPSRGEPYAAVLARGGGPPVGARRTAAPGAADKAYSMHAFGAVFTEVRVDQELGEVRVPRVVGVYGVGNRLNAKTAHSQLVGGIVYGLGMVLMEDTRVDPHLGRYVNADLADYHVPVNRDVRQVDVHFVDEQDPYVNPLGIKGIGEIGITGLSAAVANAVYHATGKRVRDLPLTPDKLL